MPELESTHHCPMGCSRGSFAAAALAILCCLGPLTPVSASHDPVGALPLPGHGSWSRSLLALTLAGNTSSNSTNATNATGHDECARYEGQLAPGLVVVYVFVLLYSFLALAIACDDYLYVHAERCEEAQSGLAQSVVVSSQR